MINQNSTNFVYHFKDVFDKKILRSLKKSIIKKKKVSKKKNHKMSQREMVAINRGEMPDVVRLNTIWYKIYKKNSTFLKKILPYSFVMYPPQIRNVKKKLDKVPWHQDRAYMKLLGKKAPKKTITCFVPLNENPKNHSSIEFAILKNKKVLTHQKVGLFNKGIKTKIDKKKRFNLNLGDALVFDDRILHRTYFKNKNTENRFSLEFRMTSKRFLTKKKDFYSIEEDRIIKL
tara:strand:- start:782 stop:1474 length:693 start_codon:yes stop_codon:yes gene_type:complete